MHLAGNQRSAVPAARPAAPAATPAPARRAQLRRPAGGMAARAAPAAAAEVDQTLNPLVAGLKVSKTMALTDMARSMRESGIDVSAAGGRGLGRTAGAQRAVAKNPGGGAHPGSGPRAPCCGRRPRGREPCAACMRGRAARDGRGPCARRSGVAAASGHAHKQCTQACISAHCPAPRSPISTPGDRPGGGRARL